MLVLTVLSLSISSNCFGEEEFLQRQKRFYGKCDVECKPETGCRGPGPQHCKQCRHYYNMSNEMCVETCDRMTHFLIKSLSFILCEVCHEECDGGCDGPTASNCHKCTNYYNVHTRECVKYCYFDKYYVTEDGKCGSCHDECGGGCGGPGDRDCFFCRNKLKGQRCVSTCRDNEYADYSNVCSECHEDCLLGCSGPLNTTGKDGCNPCQKPVLVTNSAHHKPCFDFKSICYYVDGCLKLEEACPDGHFEEPVRQSMTVSRNFASLSGKPVCFPCHTLCSKCTSYGFNSTVCQRCPQHPNCSCFPGTYFDQDFDDCKPCKTKCKECTNSETCSECSDDHKYRFYEEGYPSANGSFTCMKRCPQLQPFSSFSELYQNYCTSTNSTEESTPVSKQYGSKDIIIAVTVTIVVIVPVALFVGIIIYLQDRKNRSKHNLDIEHNQTFDDPEEPLVSSNIAPNRNKLRIIAESDVIKTEPLGSGAFGVVYRGFLLREGCNAQDPVAIKVLNPNNKETSTKEFLQEATIMGRVNHVNLLPLLAICVTSNVMLVTELMPLGDLLHYLHKNYRNIKPKTMINWCLQIARGMDYLEKDSLLHRDLAARNVLLQTIYRIKITDFGLAQAINIDQGMYESSEGKLPVKWCSLESLKTGIFTHKTDVWSFGVTVWEILTYGEEPYESCTSLPMLLATLDDGRRLGQPDSCSSILYTVLVTCWAEDATARPSFQELVDTFSLMLRDPGRCIIELKETSNKTAPEPLPRTFYQNTEEPQPDACRYENACMETNGMVHFSSSSVEPAEYIEIF